MLSAARTEERGGNKGRLKKKRGKKGKRGQAESDVRKIKER